MSPSLLSPPPSESYIYEVAVEGARFYSIETDQYTEHIVGLNINVQHHRFIRVYGKKLDTRVEGSKRYTDIHVEHFEKGIKEGMYLSSMSESELRRFLSRVFESVLILHQNLEMTHGRLNSEDGIVLVAGGAPKLFLFEDSCSRERDWKHVAELLEECLSEAQKTYELTKLIDLLRNLCNRQLTDEQTRSAILFTPFLVDPLDRLMYRYNANLHLRNGTGNDHTRARIGLENISAHDDWTERVKSEVWWEERIVSYGPACIDAEKLFQAIITDPNYPPYKNDGYSFSCFCGNVYGCVDESNPYGVNLPWQIAEQCFSELWKEFLWEMHDILVSSNVIVKDRELLC